MRYSAETRLSPAAALLRARAAFGAGGVGLRQTSASLTCLRFDSDVGHVALEARRLPNGTTQLTLETREFDR